VNCQSPNGDTALLAACERFPEIYLDIEAHLLENTAVIKFLLARGADPKIANKNNVMPFEMAVERMNIDAVKVFLLGYRNNFDINRSSQFGLTPLMRAVHFTKDFSSSDHDLLKKVSPRMTELLLISGADKTLRDKQGHTALDRAVATGNLEVVPSLLNGLSLEECIQKDVGQLKNTKVGQGLFLSALKREDCETLQTMLEAGYAPDSLYVEDYKSVKPETLSIFEQLAEIARLLGSSERLITEEDKIPALRFAIERKNVNLFHLLLDHGADVNFVSKDGKTPFDLCLESGMETAAIYILRKQPDILIRSHPTK
jgi:uncharacterized protein